MEDIQKEVLVWLVILTVIVAGILAYILFVPNINIYIPNQGNYTIDVGENMMKVYNLTR